MAPNHHCQRQLQVELEIEVILLVAQRRYCGMPLATVAHRRGATAVTASVVITESHKLVLV